MREITEKTLYPLVPDVSITAIHDQLRQYGGTRLAKPRPCPHCESRQYRKNGYQDRIFARLITDEGFERVAVNVQLYECTNCGSRFQGDVSELFYEECHDTKPIVHLCLFHAAENPYGLQVDQDTIQRYAERFGDEVADRHGVSIADCTVSMNVLSLLFGVSTVDELKDEFADELATEEIDGLVGDPDETYPAKKGAKKDLYEENMRHKQ